jgi:hypothetical protein
MEDAMKYALLLYSDPEARAGAHEDRYASWIDYTRALKASGALLGAEQLQPVGSATTLRERDGEQLLTDGPFAETKEHLLGLYLIDVPDLDAALEWAGRMPFIGFGTVEVRPVVTGMAWQAVLTE